MGYTRFKADKDIMDALVHLKNETGAGGQHPAESQFLRRHFGACFRLMMLESSRNRPSS